MSPCVEKRWPAPLQALPQLAVVVDLSVQHHRDRAVLVEDRLVPGDQVDDSQSLDPQSHAVVDVHAARIGATMLDGVAHPIQQLRLGSLPVSPILSGYAAHAPTSLTNVAVLSVLPVERILPGVIPASIHDPALGRTGAGWRAIARRSAPGASPASPRRGGAVALVEAAAYEKRHHVRTGAREQARDQPHSDGSGTLRRMSSNEPGRIGHQERKALTQGPRGAQWTAQRGRSAIPFRTMATM